MAVSDYLGSARPIQVASEETGSRILADPDVVSSLADYLARYVSHGGNPPTISGDEFRRRLRDT